MRKLILLLTALMLLSIPALAEDMEEELTLEDMLSGRRRIAQWAVQPGEDGATVLIPREEWEGRREETQ